MVSLKDRQYLEQFRSNLYTRISIDFIFEEDILGVSKNNGKKADDVAISALHAIQLNDAESFDKSYAEIKNRKPKPDSDWIYNDLLLFAMTVGVVKFDRESGWLQDVLRVRMESNTAEEKKLVTQTLLDVIRGNFESIDNNKSLMVVIKHLLSLSLGSKDYVDSTYQEVVGNTFPRYESVLLNAASLRAIDLIVFYKGLGSVEWYRATDAFLNSFLERVRQLARCLWLLILIVVGGATLYFWYYYLTSDSETKDAIDAVLRLLPSLGVTSLLAPLLTLRKKIIDLFELSLMRFFGYRIPGQNSSLK